MLEKLITTLSKFSQVLRPVLSVIPISQNEKEELTQVLNDFEELAKTIKEAAKDGRVTALEAAEINEAAGDLVQSSIEALTPEHKE